MAAHASLPLYRDDAIGIAFEPAGARIKRLTEAITILKGCFADGPFSSGEHYTITGHDGAPKPAQRPHPPIFLGGGGKRLLTLAAREARIIGLAPRLVQGDPPRVDARSLTAAAAEEKISWIREAAGDRFGELKLNTYPSGGPTVVTSDPRAEARRHRRPLPASAARPHQTHRRCRASSFSRRPIKAAIVHRPAASSDRTILRALRRQPHWRPRWRPYRRI